MTGVGIYDGIDEGCAVGKVVSKNGSSVDGEPVTAVVGNWVGFVVGHILGSVVGSMDVSCVGVDVGERVDATVGRDVGFFVVGVGVGRRVGSNVGGIDGETVIVCVGVVVLIPNAHSIASFMEIMAQSLLILSKIPCRTVILSSNRKLPRSSEGGAAGSKARKPVTSPVSKVLTEQSIPRPIVPSLVLTPPRRRRYVGKAICCTVG